jgi:hypothetical protein
VIEKLAPDTGKKAGEGRVIHKGKGLTDLRDETVHKHGIEESV